LKRTVSIKVFPVQQPLVEKTLILQVNTERNNLLYNFDCFYILGVKKKITPDFIPQNTTMAANFESEREYKG